MAHKWYDRGFIPSYIGLFMDQRSFKNYIKNRLPDRYPTFCFDKEFTSATTYEFSHNDKHSCAVVMNLKPEQDDPILVTALMAHECTHVKQYVFDAIGEEVIGPETEAYFIQHYAGRMAEDYLLWNDKRKSKNVVSKETGGDSSSPVDGR